jgi:hypothetical protein
MFFLADAAAGGAMDLFGALTKSLSGSQARNGVTTGVRQAGSSPFDIPTETAAAQPGASASSTVGATTGTPSMTPMTMDALLKAQGQQSSSGSVSSQLFSLLDSDGNGIVSKAEFAKAFAQNGDSTKVDAVFAKLDKNGDGSVGQLELSAALKGEGRHHGVAGHVGGPSDGTPANSKSGSTSQVVTNADGSVTTTVTYADGTTVSMVKPASSSAGASNALERMIQRQAQLLGSSSAGQSVAVTA